MREFRRVLISTLRRHLRPGATPRRHPHPLPSPASGRGERAASRCARQRGL